MPSKNRTPATAQLVNGQDDDLIAWYESFPRGQRNQQLKAAIRAGLGMAQPIASNGHAPAAPVDMDAIRQQLYSEWSDWTRQLIESLPGYVQSAVERAMADHQPKTSAENIVQEGERLSQDEVTNRAARLKKATW